MYGKFNSLKWCQSDKNVLKCNLYTCSSQNKCSLNRMMNFYTMWWIFIRWYFILLLFKFDSLKSKCFRSFYMISSVFNIRSSLTSFPPYILQQKLYYRVNYHLFLPYSCTAEIPAFWSLLKIVQSAPSQHKSSKFQTDGFKVLVLYVDTKFFRL